MKTYEDQLWDPCNWTVRSWHDNASAVLNNSGLPADNTILKTIVSAVANTVVGDLHPANLTFVYL